MAYLIDASGSTEVEISNVYISVVCVGDTGVRLGTRCVLEKSVIDTSGGAGTDVVNLNGDFSRVRDCWLYGTGDGVTGAVGADKNIVEGCEIVATGNGIEFGGNYNRAMNNDIDVGGYGVRMASGNYAYIEQNDVTTSSGTLDCISVYAAGSHVLSNRVYGGLNGIDLGGGSEMFCEGNYVKYPDAAGIIGDGLNYGSLNDNTVYQSGGSGYGIDLNDLYAVTINDNKIIGTAIGGLRLTDSYEVTVNGNVIEQDGYNPGIYIDWSATPFGDPIGIDISGNVVKYSSAPLQVVMSDTDEYIGLTVVGNYFEGKQVTGAGGECSIENAPGALIGSNEFYLSALKVTDSQGVAIKGNTLTGSPTTLTAGWNGVIVVDGCDNAHISGNTHGGEDLDAGDGVVHLTGTMDGAFVDGNMYTGPIPSGEATNRDYGLVIDGSVTNTLVGTNDWRECDVGETSDSGSGTDTSVVIIETEPFGFPGTVTTGTGGSRLYAAVDMTIIDVRASCGTAPSGGACTVDVNKNGTSIYPTSSPPSITSGNNVSSLAVPDTTAVSADDYITIDVDAANGAEDLVVTLRWRKT